MPDTFLIPDPERVAVDHARTVTAPPFDAVLLRARANRRRRQAVAGVAGLAVAAVVVGVAVGPAQDQSRARLVPPASHTGPVASPTPTTTATSGPAAAERIVTDPRAGVLDLGVSGSDPGVRAITMGGALGLSGADTQWATAVTTDGFRTSRFVDAGAPGAGIVPLPGDRFFIGSATERGRAWIVGTDGSRTAVAFGRGTHPAAAGEVLVSCGSWQYCALDPDTATAHSFPGPTPAPGRDPGLMNGQFTLWQDGRAIWGYSGNSDEPPHRVAVYWSTDGGAHWAERPVPGLGSGTRLATAATGGQPELAFAYGTGHGALYSGQVRVPVRTLLRSRDGGTSWQTVPFPDGDITDGAVLPDGRAVLVTKNGHLYRSTDSSWAGWTDLTAAWPATGGDEQHLAVSGAGALYSTRVGYGRDRGSVWQSLDAGATWQLARQPTG